MDQNERAVFRQLIDDYKRLLSSRPAYPTKEEEALLDEAEAIAATPEKQQLRAESHPEGTP